MVAIVIFDCIPMFNELEVLDIRLHELDPVVDVFVIAEATATYQGNPKPLNFKENEHLFKPWRDKIIYLGVEYPKDLEAQCHAGLYKDDATVHTPSGPDLNWARERYQHDAVMQGLLGCKDDDIVMLCDLDEIPRANGVRNYKTDLGLRCFEMLSFYYYLNVMVGKWGRAKILPYGILRQSTPSNIRTSEAPTFPGGDGWHYSYIGGPERIVYKFQSFAHAEFNTPALSAAGIRTMLDNGMQVGGSDPNFAYSNYEIFPEYIEQNRAKFEALGLIRYPAQTTHPHIIGPQLLPTPTMP